MVRIERLTKHLWLVLLDDGYSETAVGRDAALARANELEPGAQHAVTDDTGLPSAETPGARRTATIEETENAIAAGVNALRMEGSARARVIGIYNAMRLAAKGKPLQISKKRRLKPRI